MVTTVFANNFLNVQLAENEYSASKQFMLTTGLQVDDVAWTMGAHRQYAIQAGMET
jgi:hypothetical protein